jgi:4-amino-4-deoxychorismate lyase
MLSWIDGQSAELLSVKDRGLAYGDGLFATLGVRHGVPQLLERQLARLALGCRRLALPCEQSLLRNELLAFAAQMGEGVLKLIITRGDGQRGYAAPQPCQVRRILQAAPLPSYPAVNAAHGVQLFPCLTRLAEQPLLAGIKHLNRLEQVLARAEWQSDMYAEGLMCDATGRVVEAVYSNLFVVQAGQLLTPALTRCGVAGVMRAELLAQAMQLGITVLEQDLSYAQLLAADEVFVCNSLYGVWPVCGLAGHDWPVGPLTRKLQAIADDLLGC